MARKQRKHKHKTKRRQRGAGWSDTTSVRPIAPGYLPHVPYPGIGKDCADNSYQRPGHLPGGLTGGLPGFRGGSQKQRRRGGMLAIAPMDDSITPKPADFPRTDGAAGNMASMPNTMSSAGVPTPSGAQMAQAQPQMQQKGGRYEAGPLAPLSSNGVGTTPGALSIPCERGYINPLNPHMKGGMTLSPASYSGASGFSAANFPRVTVGAPDMMRYEAPNAGYRNDFETYRAPSAVGGLTMQTPYAAGSFNQACLKTGGSRRSRKRGGNPFISEPAPIQPLQPGQIGNRMDFDGTKGGLPCKFGGSRRKRRSQRRSRRRQRK